ncbi:STAS domain-containing protein [Paracoccus sp. MBLB3053]|uniref:STAS domain-containing protein n=1 Tax=Paracoccus aurantius TaxID=3073814 RepID=A0ABU2HMV2_9RHOB|nr:STAS domain-containing protein [Paracoccus sp. MBLB3053]MDS9466364.1 STAS domain-containing protein [Paracoccus sp. MBLB3053]
MQLTLLPHNDGITIRVDERRLDAAIATAFKDRVRNLAVHGGSLVTLDLSPVDFMDSSGLGAVIAIFKSMPAGRRLELIGLTPNVERVFRLTRMDTIMTIRPGSPCTHPGLSTEPGE